MFVQHLDFDLPPDDTVIWKYLDLSKFLDLLLCKQIFMARAEKFDDQFEGTFSEPSYEEIKKLIEDKPEYLQQYKEQRKNIVISSWHANPYESFAMWQIFTKNNEGLAIQSTIGRLKNAFTEKFIAQHIGKVQYIDYKKERMPFDNDYFPFLYKRKSFQYEHEVRVITNTLGFEKQYADGIKINVDVNTLIDKIYIHPKSHNWYKRLVTELVEKMGYQFQIEKSDLESDILI